MKKTGLALGLVGVAGFGVAGFLLLKKNNKNTQAATSAGGSAVDYSSGSYADWAAQQKAPVTNVQPIGIFKTAVDETMNFISSITEPRGIRNKNPLNIEWNSVNKWVGLVGSDGRFCIFDKPENGIRAGAKTLDSYARRGVITIQQIIETWAPKPENNVKAYVDHVCKLMNKTPNYIISKAAGDYVPLIAAMIKHENGKQPYALSVIQAGVNLSK